MQQSYARVSGCHRTAYPSPSWWKTPCASTPAGLERHDVRVVREYANVPPVHVDKHKVLQILVNLIRNAKHAL